MKIGSILFVRGISIFLYVMLTTFYPVARGTLDNYAAYNDTMNSLRYNSRRALEAFHQRSLPLGRIYAHQAKIAFETAIRYHPAACRPYLDWGTFLLQKQALDPTGEQEASCDWLRTAWDLLQSHRKHHATSPDVSATNNHLDVDTYAGTPRSHEAKGKGEILQRERNSVQTIGWIPLARAVHFRWSQCEYSILERRYREAIDRQDVSTAIGLLRLQDELLPRNVDTLYRISRLLDGDENSFQTAESVVVDGFARYLSEWDAFTHRNGCSYESRPERNAVAESSVRHSSGKNRGGVERSNARIFRKGLRWPTRFRHKIFRDTLCVPWARAYGDAAVIVPIETCDILLPLHTFSGFFLLSDHVPHFVPTYPRIPPGSRWTKTKRELQNTAPPSPLRWESREETVTWEQLWEDEESHFEYTHDRERVRIRTISEAEAGDAIALHILHNGKYESQHIPSGIRPAHLTSHGRIPSLLASPPSRARTLLHEPFPLFTDSVSFSLVTFPTILDSWRHYRSWMLDALPRLISAMPMLHTMTHDNGKGLLTLLLPIAGNSEALTSMDWTRRHLKWKEFLSLHVEKKPKTCDQRFKTRLFLPAYIHRSLSFFFSELFEAVSDRLRVLFYPQYGTIDEDQQGGGGGAYNTERLRADWLCIGNEQEGSSPEKLHRVLHAFVQTKIERTRLVEKRGKTSRTMVILRSGLQGDSDTLRYHMEELIWEHLQTLQRTLRNQRHKTLIRIVSLWSRGRTIALTCDEEREAIGMGTAQEQQEWDGALLAKHLGNALAIIGHSDDPSMADLLFCRAGTYILELTDKSHLETNTVSLDHPWWKQFFSSLDLVHARTNYETDQNTAHSWNRETTFRSVQEALNTMWEYSIQQVSEEGQRDEM